MKEKLQEITKIAELIYEMTNGYYTISEGKRKNIQYLVGELQENLDDIANELRNCPF